MDHSLLSDDNKLIEEELKAMQRFEEKKEKRKKKKKNPSIELVDLFLEEESQNALGMEEVENKYQDTALCNKGNINESNVVAKEDGNSQKKVAKEDGKIQTKGAKNKDKSPKKSRDSNLHNRSESNECKVPTEIENLRKKSSKEMRCESVESVEDISDEAFNVSDSKKHTSNPIQNVRTVVVTPIQASEEAAILSCVLIGMTIEASYPPKLYSKLFESNKMEKMVAHMRREERLLILKMVEDW